MGRITIKGGTWKNTEDEILKVRRHDNRTGNEMLLQLLRESL